MKLFVANRWRNFGILNTTDGSVKKALYEMSSRSRDARSANSLGSLVILLFAKNKSKKKSNE